MESTYSVLMSVYKNENPDFLRMSMMSIFDQTVPTNDFVLVCDGILTKGLEKIITEMTGKFGNILHVIRLKENRGLGYALQVGINECKNNYIARMDSDDISRPYRCEKEMEFLNSHPDISIVGSVIEEFSENTDKVISRRTVPERNGEIVKFAKIRNPFNHPSVMYRKIAVLAAGNYSNIRYMQDYYLWVDMLIAGMKGYNIQEPLVWMRVDNNFFMRRSGELYAKIQVNLLRKMRVAGLINYPEFVGFCLIRMMSSFAPNCIRRAVIKTVLRN